MRRSNRRLLGLVRRLIPAVWGMAMLAACSDQQPLGGSEAALSAPPSSSVVQAFDCTGSIEGLAVSCRSSSGSAGEMSAAILVGVDSGAAELITTNVSYDSVTLIYQMDVAVKNLLEWTMGTQDGTTLDASGIRVFFAHGPYGSPTGDVSVANPDGSGMFIGGVSPYFLYDEILPSNAVSSVRTWQFNLDPAATEIYFTVMISTAAYSYSLLLINEVLANPGGTISDTNGEWFEVYNPNSHPVDMTGFLIADSAAAGRRPYHVIASSLVVPAGGYVVLGNTTNTTTNGGVTVDHAYGSALALANGMDALKIARVHGTDTITVDRVKYSSAAISAQNGVSRERTNTILDNLNMDGSIWADASTGAVYGTGGRGTPRAQNSAFVP